MSGQALSSCMIAWVSTGCSSSWTEQEGQKSARPHHAQRGVAERDIPRQCVPCLWRPGNQEDEQRARRSLRGQQSWGARFTKGGTAAAAAPAAGSGQCQAAQRIAQRITCAATRTEPICSHFLARWRQPLAGCSPAAAVMQSFRSHKDVEYGKIVRFAMSGMARCPAGAAAAAAAAAASASWHRSAHAAAHHSQAAAISLHNSRGSHERVVQPAEFTRTFQMLDCHRRALRQGPGHQHSIKRWLAPN